MKTPEEWREHYIREPQHYLITNMVIDVRKEAIAETEDFYEKIIHDLKEDSTNYQFGKEDGIKEERERCLTILDNVIDRVRNELGMRHPAVPIILRLIACKELIRSGLEAEPDKERG